MGLRPFWKRHPFALRMVAGSMLLLSPLLLLYCAVAAAWEDRDSIKRLFRELVDYVIEGGE